MSYGSISGRARTSARYPEAHAICDNCGFRYNLVNLQWQMQWAGNQLINQGNLVCSRCKDVPQQQLRAIAIAADPVPVTNPRIEQFAAAANTLRQTSGENTTDPITGLPVINGATRITQEDQQRITQQTGEAPGGLNQLPGTNLGAPDSIGASDPGLPYNSDEVPDTGPLV